MQMSRRSLSIAALAVPLGAGSRRATAQTPAETSVPPATLFAVEFRTGKNWDKAKRPLEQAYFREHSANLKRLRDTGRLVVGARYSDKGLVVLTADSEADVRALVDADPSVQNQVFEYAVHPFHVFYNGCLEAPKRR